MTFDRAFRLSSYLLLLAGFFALFASEAIGPIVTLLYMSLVLFSWRVRPFLLPNWAQLVVFILLVAFFLVDALTISDFISATVHLLIIVSLIKLFTRKVERDYLILYFVSFGFLLFAAAYTISIAFLAALILYIFSSILTFILFESKKAYEENRAAHFSLAGYVNVALVITALIILISIPIFVVIPRVSMGFFRMDRRLDLNLSGFSEKVNLGDMGEIIVNGTVVMRAKIDTALENLPSDLKWRGIALDHYDGQAWSNTREGFHQLERSGPSGEVIVTQERRNNEFLVQQSVLLEPFSNIVFGTPRIVSVSGDILRRNYLFEDGNDSIGMYRRSRGLLRYVVYSDVMTREEKLLMAAQGPIPKSLEQRYLQLPSLHPPIQALAQEVTRRRDTWLEKGLAIERYLREEYLYSLENKPAEAEDPLYDFLFVTRAGHCEYFATAQAIMMRCAGIPTRVVNGFRLGEFNEFSDYFVVRQSDAHSWVEAYLPGAGWVEFDSTPYRRAPKQALTLGRLFTQLLDAIDIFWTEVITFDRVKQIWFFRSLGYSLQDTWSKMYDISGRLDDLARRQWVSTSIRDWDLTKLLYLLLVPLVVGLPWSVYRYRRYLRIFWKQRVLGRESSEIAPEYYLEMLDLLGRKGLIKRPAETPAEFAARVRKVLGLLPPLQITDLYYRSRFGHHPLAASDMSRIHASLRELR